MFEMSFSVIPNTSHGSLQNTTEYYLHCNRKPPPARETMAGNAAILKSLNTSAKYFSNSLN
jgi:hypothetical protein